MMTSPAMWTPQADCTPLVLDLQFYSRVLQRLLAGSSLWPTPTHSTLAIKKGGGQNKQMEKWWKALSETLPRDLTCRADVGMRKQTSLSHSAGGMVPQANPFGDDLSVHSKSFQNMPVPYDAATYPLRFILMIQLEVYKFLTAFSVQYYLE